MSEHIDSQSWIATGGHAWLWGPMPVTRKVVGSVGLRGAYGMVTSIPPRPVRIGGANGQQAALLKVAAANRNAADAAMTAIERAIEDLIYCGYECAWEDDLGHWGTALVIAAYERSGPRVYAAVGAQVRCWQYYHLDAIEMNGGVL